MYENILILPIIIFLISLISLIILSIASFWVSKPWIRITISGLIGALILSFLLWLVIYSIINVQGRFNVKVDPKDNKNFIVTVYDAPEKESDEEIITKGEDIRKIKMKSFKGIPRIFKDIFDKIDNMKNKTGEYKEYLRKKIVEYYIQLGKDKDLMRLQEKENKGSIEDKDLQSIVESGEKDEELKKIVEDMNKIILEKFEINDTERNNKRIHSKKIRKPFSVELEEGEELKLLDESDTNTYEIISSSDDSASAASTVRRLSNPQIISSKPQNIPLKTRIISSKNTIISNPTIIYDEKYIVSGIAEHEFRDNSLSMVPRFNGYTDPLINEKLSTRPTIFDDKSIVAGISEYIIKSR